jgi:hypothetical protein
VVSRVLSPTRNSKASRCLKGFTSCGEDLLAEPARGHLWILVLRVDVHQFSVRYQFRGADERRRTEVAAVRHEVFLSTVRSQVSLLVLHQRYDLRGEREEGEKRPMRDHRLRISRTINLCWWQHCTYVVEVLVADITGQNHAASMHHQMLVDAVTGGERCLAWVRKKKWLMTSIDDWTLPGYPEVLVVTLGYGHENEQISNV